MVAVIVLSAAALSMYLAPLLPVLVGLVTKAATPGWFKGIALTLLSGVTAAIAPAIQTGTSIKLDGAWLGQFAVVNVVALAVYFGLLKPAGVTQKVQAKVPGGLGPMP